MSERNPGAGGDPRRSPDWPEWPDEQSSGSSVFDERTVPGSSSVFEQDPTQPTHPASTPGHHHQELPQYQAPPQPPQQHQAPPNQAHVPYIEPTRPIPQQPPPGYGWPDAGPTPRQHPGYGDQGYGDRGYGQGYGQPSRGPATPPGGQPPHLPRKQRRQDRRDSGRDSGPSRRSGGGGGGGGGFGLPFGFGFLVGILGLGALLASLMVMPWFEFEGREVTLANIREAFTVPATDPETLPGAADQPDTTTAEGALPTPDQARDAVEGEVRDVATEAAASAIDTGKNRYLELYAETLWWVIAIAAGLSVLFSTVLAPKSTALGLILGFRRLSGFVTILGAAAHGAALWVIFSGDGPAPGLGVWVGVAGLAGVFLASIIGPKR